jgi:hypothetical protein
LKKDTALLRSSCDDQLTKAHDDLVMRKIDEGPRQAPVGIVVSMYFHSSSCDVFGGLDVSMCRRSWTYTFPTHVTQSHLLLSGSCG